MMAPSVTFAELDNDRPRWSSRPVVGDQDVDRSAAGGAGDRLDLLEGVVGAQPRPGIGRAAVDAHPRRPDAGQVGDPQPVDLADARPGSGVQPQRRSSRSAPSASSATTSAAGLTWRVAPTPWPA
jgi:hypothetical protein